MAQFKRADRVAGEIQRVLSEVLLAGVNDPRVTPLSILGVHLSPDLSVAHVNYVSLGGVADPAVLAEGLRAASGFLRREVGQKLNLRHVPKLVFHLDESIDENIRMVKFLQDLVVDDGASEADTATSQDGEGDAS